MNYKKKEPEVSVVLTTYNRAVFLSKSIESILNQTFTDFELIICDNCSSDNTEDVVKKYIAEDSRILYIRNHRNLGMPANLNVGLRRARGEFIANLHDGDIYDLTLLEKWISVLRSNAKTAFVFNAYRVLDEQEKEKIIYREKFPLFFPGSVLMNEYFRRWKFDSPVYGMVMARKTVYDKLGLFDEQFGFYADIDMWMRMASDYDVGYVNEPLMSLPSKKVVPRLFNDARWRVQKNIERIFWKNRMHFYSANFIKRYLEAIRHYVHMFCARSLLLLIYLKHFLGIKYSFFGK